ncbi:hypothetical protein MN0502_07470 [Arthrobacter sp. MN05-02]|nr:hypothetical protein MN0502_07470 [Arthrobacter sp. MN05-02]
MGRIHQRELSQSINLVLPKDAKGLEFDSVIVVDPQEILDEPHGARLLYIALTRTTTRLDVLYPVGRLPEVLGGKPLSEESAGVEPAPQPSPEPSGGINQVNSSSSPGYMGGGTRVAKREELHQGSLSRVERSMVQAAAAELLAELESVPANLRPYVVAELTRLSAEA